MAQLGNVRLPTHWSSTNKLRYSAELARELKAVTKRDQADPRGQMIKANLEASYVGTSPRHTKHATEHTYWNWVKHGRTPWEQRAKAEGRAELKKTFVRHHLGIVKANETVGIFERTFEEPFGTYRSDQALARLLELSKVLLLSEGIGREGAAVHQQGLQRSMGVGAVPPSGPGLLMRRLAQEPGLETEVERLFAEFNSAEVLSMKPKLLVDYIRMYQLFERRDLDQEGSLPVAANEGIFELEPGQVLRLLTDLLVVGQRRAHRLQGVVHHPTAANRLSAGYGRSPSLSQADRFGSPLADFSPVPGVEVPEGAAASPSQSLVLSGTTHGIRLSSETRRPLHNSCQDKFVATYFEGLPLGLRLQVYAPKVCTWLTSRHKDRKRQTQLSSPKQLGGNKLTKTEMFEKLSWARRLALPDEMASLKHGGDPLSTSLWYVLEATRMNQQSTCRSATIAPFATGGGVSTSLLATEATANKVTREPCSQLWVYCYYTCKLDEEFLADYWWSLDRQQAAEGSGSMGENGSSRSSSSMLTATSMDRMRHLVDFTELLGVPAVAAVLKHSIEMPIRRVRAMQWLGSLVEGITEGLSLLKQSTPATTTTTALRSHFVDTIVCQDILSSLLSSPERRAWWSEVLQLHANTPQSSASEAPAAHPQQPGLVEVRSTAWYEARSNKGGRGKNVQGTGKFGLQRFHRHQQEKKSGQGQQEDPLTAATCATKSSFITLFTTAVDHVMQADAEVSEQVASTWAETAHLLLTATNCELEDDAIAVCEALVERFGGKV